MTNAPVQSYQEQYDAYDGSEAIASTYTTRWDMDSQLREWFGSEGATDEELSSFVQLMEAEGLIWFCVSSQQFVVFRGDYETRHEIDQIVQGLLARSVEQSASL